MAIVMGSPEAEVIVNANRELERKRAAAPMQIKRLEEELATEKAELARTTNPTERAYIQQWIDKLSARIDGWRQYT